MEDTSGPRFCEPFATYDPVSSCWRTSQGTFPWGSDEYSETWPKQGTTRTGHAYERPTLAPVIDANEFSSSLTLPSPTARLGDETSRGADAARYKGPQSMNGRRSNLDDAMAAITQRSPWLPTPTARDGKAGMDYRQRAEGTDLLGALLPTPTSNQPGGTAEQHLARKNRMPDGATRTSVTDLRMALQLLPTPDVYGSAYGANTDRVKTRTPDDRSIRLVDAIAASAPTSPPSTDGPTPSDDQPPQDSMAND